MPMTYKSMDQANLSPQLCALPNVFSWIPISQTLKSCNVLHASLYLVAVHLSDLITHTFPLLLLLQATNPFFISLTVWRAPWTLGLYSATTISLAFNSFLLLFSFSDFLVNSHASLDLILHLSFSEKPSLLLLVWYCTPHCIEWLVYTFELLTCSWALWKQGAYMSRVCLYT